MMCFSAAYGQGPITQFIWATQPNLATNGLKFGQHPVIQTADVSGTPSTVGLPPVKLVTVGLYNGTAGTLSGTLTANIGTAGGNGSVSFPVLQIDQPGTAYLIAVDGGAGFLPTNITAGSSCQLWLDASDLSTLGTDSSGINITNWLDKSGKGNNAGNTTAGQAPALTSDGALSSGNAGFARAVSFNGIADALNMNLSSLAGQPYTVIALTVWQSQTHGYFVGNDGNGNTDLNLHIGYNSATDFHWGQYGDDLDLTAVFNQNEALLSEEVMSAAKVESLYTNTLLAASRTAGGFLAANNLAQGRVGRAQGGNNIQADIAELMIFNTALSTQDRTNMENYLWGKWLGRAGAFAGVSSAPFTVQASPINTLTFVSPSINNAVEGTPITASTFGEVRVQASDVLNHPVIGATVTLVMSTGSGVLTGTNAVTDAAGIAHFTNVTYNKAGIGYTLTANSAGIASSASNPFNITSGAPASLSVETAPDGTGTVVPAQNLVADTTLTVYAITRDAQGNFVANVPATWSLVNITGGVVSGNLVPSGDTMSATMTGLLVGTANIQAVATFTAQSGVITVVGGAPATLVLTTPPSTWAAQGLPFGVEPVLTVLDVHGNPSATVISVNAGSSGPINGTTSINTVNGVAAFFDLFWGTTGTFNINFTCGSLTPVTSGNMTVTLGNATILAWATQPGAVTNGINFGQQPVLVAMDAFNEVTGAGLPAVKLVQINIYSGSGVLAGIVRTNIGTAGGNGSVTLPNLNFTGNGTIQLVAYDVGNGFIPTNITAGASCQLWLDASDITSYVTKPHSNMLPTGWIRAARATTQAMPPQATSLSGVKATLRLPREHLATNTPSSSMAPQRSSSSTSAASAIRPSPSS